jgi:tRNA (mo5U34)-methyltransferase
MARRAVHLGGVSVAVDISPHLVARVRRLTRRPPPADDNESQFVFLDPLPALNFEERDPASALDFVRPPEGGERPDKPQDAPLAERVEALSWYHTIDLPGGVVTPGVFDHRPLLSRYGLPADLTGKRALDAASFDGFWAFELEKRGATVTSLDIDRVSRFDLPGPVRDQMAREGLDRTHDANRNFALAHEALGSKVDRIIESIYDLNPEKHGTFDFVHMADVLLHLESPTRALRALRSVCGSKALIVDSFSPELDDINPGAGRIVRYFGGWHDLIWWNPSLSTLAQMVVDAGFRNVRLHGCYRLGKRSDQDQGLWRAILAAEV